MKIRSIVQTLAIVTVAGSTLTAYSPSKVAQCDALSSQINKASGLGKKFEAVGQEMSPKNGSIKSLEDFQRVSKQGSKKVKTLVLELNGFVNGIKRTDVQDTNLISYRDRSVVIYSRASTSLSKIADILQRFSTVEANEIGKKTIEDSLKDLNKEAIALESVDKDEKAIAREFNSYCGVTQ